MRYCWHFPHLAGMAEGHFSPLKLLLVTDNMTDLLSVFQHQPITSVVMAINIAIAGSLFTLDWNAANAGFLLVHQGKASKSINTENTENFLHRTIYQPSKAFCNMSHPSYSTGKRRGSMRWPWCNIYKHSRWLFQLQILSCGKWWKGCHPQRAEGKLEGARDLESIVVGLLSG